MKLSDVLNMYIISKEGMRFDVLYSSSGYCLESDELYDFSIIKTAEEVCMDYLISDANTLSDLNILKKDNSQLWDCVESTFKELGYIPTEVENERY